MDENIIKPIVNHTIVFMDQDIVLKSKYTKWYPNVNNLYKKILISKGFTVITQDLGIDELYHIKNNLNIDNMISEISENNIYVFNPIDFASFFLSANKPILGEKIEYFLKNIKYIVLWQEILQENLHIIGYGEVDTNFIFNYFKNSKLNIVSNMVSIDNLKKHNINHNVYSTITGYSLINDLIPFNNNIEKDIDILFYGTFHPTYDYRKNTISKLNELNNKNDKKYVIQISENIYDNELDQILQRTKIIIHVPSHANLNHMPWPKITYLQARKIFFIIEDNQELHDNKIDNFIIHYKQNDVPDLFRLIEYYLQNDELREKIISENYDYILKNSNMDVMVPNLITKIL